MMYASGAQRNGVRALDHERTRTQDSMGTDRAAEHVMQEDCTVFSVYVCTDHMHPNLIDI